MIVRLTLFCTDAARAGHGVLWFYFLGVHYKQRFAVCYTGMLSCLSRMSVTLVYCGQTVGWIKIPLATEVDPGPSDCVLDGDPAPHENRHSTGTARAEHGVVGF